MYPQLQDKDARLAGVQFREHQVGRVFWKRVHKTIAPLRAFDDLAIAHQVFSATRAFTEIVPWIEQGDPMRQYPG